MVNDLNKLMYDLVLDLCPNSYINRALTNTATPYLVIKSESTHDTYPTTDAIIKITIYDKQNSSFNNIETIAQKIVDKLMFKSISNSKITIHPYQVLRQQIDQEHLVDTIAIELQMSTRIYRKETI